jgi:3-oxoacid CoA-transferase
MARGNHLDVVVLGGYQVDARGDLANWSIPKITGGAIGGAMDLVVSDTDVMVLMTHCDRDGTPKLVEECNLPVTGVDCVNIVVTDLCVVRRERGKQFKLEQVAPGFSREEIESVTGFSLGR